MNSKLPATMDLVKLCCRVLDNKKAGELTVLDVSEQSSITDYLIVATATSEPHLRALRVELEKIFARLSEAYRILSDRTQREMYDRQWRGTGRLKLPFMS